MDGSETWGARAFARARRTSVGRRCAPLALSSAVAAVLLAFGPTAGAQDLGENASQLAGLPEGQAGAPIDESSYDLPGRIVVDGVDSLDEGDVAALARDYGLSFEPTDLEDQTRIQLASVPPSEVPRLLARLRADQRVQHAEPLARVRALFEPDDPLLKEQWHMTRVGAPRAWDFATGRGVTVAVVDTGIACETHGEFNKGSDLNRTTCVGGWNFVANNEHASDDQGHGSHVAGTIAQSTDNAIGATGVAFHARLMPVKVLNELGWGTTADVADGIRWAADHGAHVINLSLGGPRNSKILQDAVDHAISRGVVVVAAAGNTGGRVGYPGASEGVIGVSATGADDKIAPFSSRGDGVDIAAPGVNVIQQTVCNRGRDKCERFPGFSGTSMASPHVAGAAALVMSLGITDPAAVEDALRVAARKVDESAEAPKLYGAGILQADHAVSRVSTRQALVRFGALGVMLGLLAYSMRLARTRRSSVASALHPAVLAPAVAAGPGLLFFAPWLLSRVYLPVDLLARPIADLDLYVGLSVHKFLPLANAVVPFGLTALGFGVPALRRPLAGFAAGTAAYLAAAVFLGEHRGPFGAVPMVLWCALNAVACLWLARINLLEADEPAAKR